MSRKTEEIIEKLKALCGKQISIEPATVKSVDEAKHTCTVELDDIELEDVRLNAVNDDNDKTSFIIPKVNSWVLIAYIQGNEADAFVSAFSEIEKIIIQTSGIEITADSIVINNGDNNGLVKVAELTQKLNTLENDLNTIKQVFSSWVPVANDGGAALKSASASWSGSQLQQTKQADIENDKIKH